MGSEDAAILHAEVAALQAVLISLLRRAASEQPDLTPLLCAAFDDADSVLTGLAVQLGGEVSGPTTLNALRVVDEIRSGVLGSNAACFGAGG
ncbi:MAG: hypothetical protein ACK4SZ_16475 [Allosphingosinicella sp.]|uniref:hypothetical protein n=1 Tax=Allosphingosinicella sp. TaxID=2823234 RepID=UPI00394D58FC